MKLYRILAAALTVVLISSTAFASDNNRKDERTRTRLKDQNRRLQEMVDSRQLELHYSDGIANEILSVYEENENRSAAGLNPEDYTVEVSDSLLNIWYSHKMASDDEMEVYDMDSIRFESNVPDEVYIERIKKMNSFISLPYNEIVKN